LAEHPCGAERAEIMPHKWTGTKQRNDLKRCPFCDTAAVQQVRLADSATDMQWRIGCGNSFCLVEPNTPPYAALTNAEHAWQDRPAKAALDDTSIPPAWKPGGPRCEHCDSGMEPGWGWCPWCGQIERLTR
jgi:hypothetical protein